MTALILCAALSVICVGTLALARQDRNRAARALQSLEAQETMHSAVLKLAAEVMASQGEYRLSREIGSVRLTAENEAYKWPLNRFGEVTPVTLSHRTRALTLADLEEMATRQVETRFQWPVNDCFRQLVSPFGYASTTEDRPRPLSPFTSGARDGQVWRFRAVLGQRVHEQLVRFTGNPVQPYALITDDAYALAEMPTCTL